MPRRRWLGSHRAAAAALLQVWQSVRIVAAQKERRGERSVYPLLRRLVPVCIPDQLLPQTFGKGVIISGGAFCLSSRFDQHWLRFDEVSRLVVELKAGRIVAIKGRIVAIKGRKRKRNIKLCCLCRKEIFNILQFRCRINGLRNLSIARLTYKSIAPILIKLSLSVKLKDGMHGGQNSFLGLPAARWVRIRR